MKLQKKDIVEANWPKLRKIYAMTTTRNGGISKGGYSQLNLAYHVGDSCDDVDFNRNQLRSMLGQEPFWLQQVHSNKVVDADGTIDDLRADGIITTRENFPIAIMTADCLPVVMADEKEQVVGVIHAGWRGLSQGIIEKMIEAFSFKGVHPNEIQAWIGPSITMENYEVSEEVRSVFHEYPKAFHKTRPRHWLADLKSIAIDKMKTSGLNSISDSGLCTYANKNFYSYRRDKACGRLATIITKLA